LSVVTVLDAVSQSLFLLFLVGMEAPVAYYHLLMIQFVKKLRSRTLYCHTNMTELTPQRWHQK